MQIEIAVNPAVNADRRAVEVVERKGIGHPDTLADAIADAVSRAYSAYCLAEFGRIAHHWFDKVMLIGGESVVQFGRGTLTKPLLVRVSGKGALTVGDHPIPLAEIARTAAAEVLARVLPRLDVLRHLAVEIEVNDHVGAGRSQHRYRPRSVEDLPELGDVAAYSNDSVITAAFAPLSQVERLVLELEGWLTSPSAKDDFPDTGFDVKVIAMRHDSDVDLVLRVPFIADLVPDEPAYRRRTELLRQAVTAYLDDRSALNVTLHLNADDALGNTYLTATGTVGDTGDIGVVGRGNRANGLITPNRPMSIEAPAGKNPADHTGKLYSELAARIAEDAATATAEHAQVTVATGRGRLLTDPQAVFLEVADVTKTSPEELEASVRLRVQEVGDLGTAFLTKMWVSE